MYEAKLKNGRCARYFIGAVPAEAEEAAEYLSVKVPTNDRQAAWELQRRGYLFAERSLPMAIPLRSFKAAVRPGKRFEFAVTAEWDPAAVYTVAQQTFDTDNRFALDLAQADRELKNELLHRFILDQRRQGTMATLLRGDGQLQGFNLWRLESGVGRVWLGAVAEKYRGAGLAFPLYCHTMEAMRERGAAALRDIVGTSNAAALDLHAMLVRCVGGNFRFGACNDLYKKETFLGR